MKIYWIHFLIVFNTISLHAQFDGAPDERTFRSRACILFYDNKEHLVSSKSETVEEFGFNEYIFIKSREGTAPFITSSRILYTTKNRRGFDIQNFTKYAAFSVDDTDRTNRVITEPTKFKSGNCQFLILKDNIGIITSKVTKSDNECYKSINYQPIIILLRYENGIWTKIDEITLSSAKELPSIRYELLVTKQLDENNFKIFNSIESVTINIKEGRITHNGHSVVMKDSSLYEGMNDSLNGSYFINRHPKFHFKSNVCYEYVEPHNRNDKFEHIFKNYYHRIYMDENGIIKKGGYLGTSKSFEGIGDQGYKEVFINSQKLSLNNLQDFNEAQIIGIAKGSYKNDSYLTFQKYEFIQSDNEIHIKENEIYKHSINKLIHAGSNGKVIEAIRLYNNDILVVLSSDYEHVCNRLMSFVGEYNFTQTSKYLNEHQFTQFLIFDSKGKELKYSHDYFLPFYKIRPISDGFIIMTNKDTPLLNFDSNNKKLLWYNSNINEFLEVNDIYYKTIRSNSDGVVIIKFDNMGFLSKMQVIEPSIDINIKHPIAQDIEVSNNEICIKYESFTANIVNMPVEVIILYDFRLNKKEQYIFDFNNWSLGLMELNGQFLRKIKNDNYSNTYHLKLIQEK